MTTLPLPVDERVVRAFESTPSEQRAQGVSFLASLAEALFHRDDSEAARQENIRELKRLMDKMGKEAAANGWTAEMDEALLRGDFDHE